MDVNYGFLYRQVIQKSQCVALHLDAVHLHLHLGNGQIRRHFGVFSETML